jgi:murein DD-endopeptidase MepM/ murein hydrolase activator NlpD
MIGNIVLAATSSELKEQQKQKQSEINAAKEEQSKIRSQMSTIQKEVDDLNNKINTAQSEIDNLTIEIEEKTKLIDETTIKLEKTQKELEEKENMLEKRLVASYKAGDTSYLDVLLTSGSITEFLSNYYLIEQINEYDSELIETIKQTKKEIEEDKIALEDAKKTLEAAKNSEQIKKQSLATLKSEKSSKVANLSAEDKELQGRIDEMRQQDAAIQAAIKRAQAAEAAAARNNGGGSTPTVPKGGYIWPVPSAYAKVTTGLYYSSGAYHGAIDFGVAGISGQPVYAVKAGTVVLTQSLSYSYGNYVLINHHDGTYTLYAHGQAGSICVSEGQNVSQGQQLMRVGSTGNSTGPHLHFEVRVAPGGYANRVNPLNYL